MTGAETAADESGASDRLLGGLCYVDDRMDEARSCWESAFRKLRDAGALLEAAQVAIDLAGLHVSIFGQVVVGRGWAERARVLLERVGPCVEWGYLELAFIACDRTDVDALLASAARALDIAIEHGDSDLEALAMADSGLALVTQGHTAQGFARLDAALAAMAAGEIGVRAAALSFCSALTACDRAGDVRRAEEWTRLAEELLRAHDNKPRALHTHCRLAYGSVLREAGRWPEAEALMLEALGPADDPNISHRALTVAHLAELRVAQGRIDEAADMLVPFEDRTTSCGPLARVYVHQGNLDLAAATLRRGLQELVGDALRAGPLLALQVDVELARGDVDAARAAAGALVALAASVDLPALRADSLVAGARVAAATGAADDAIAAYEHAKRALADDARPLQLGTVRLELAEVLAGAGDAPGAIAEARAALAGFERLGAAAGRDRATALLRSLGDSGRARPQQAAELPERLTRREQEVLALVSQGLTNAQIGERLFISTKTAEHHVGRILTKLGVRSRAEAAALAVRLAATSGDGRPAK